MHLPFALVCVAVGFVNVFGRCVEDHEFGHALDKESRELKDVEFIGKNLKFKLDHGLAEKEFLAKNWEAIKAIAMAAHKTAADKSIGESLAASDHVMKDLHASEAAEMDLKKLHALLGHEVKKEEIAAQEAKALEKFFEILSAKHNKEELLMKKEATDGLYGDVLKKESSVLFLKPDPVAHGEAGKGKKLEHFAGDAEDVKAYLAGVLLHMKMNKDAEAEGKDGEILKKFAESKIPDKLIPYFLMHDDAKAYFEGVAKSEELTYPEVHAKTAAESETMKKFVALMKEAAQKDESVRKAIAEMSHQGKTMEEIAEVFAKGFHLEKDIGIGEAHDLKAFKEHAVLHKAGPHDHEKDVIYDEMLKKEEFHPLDGDEEEAFHGLGKVKESKTLAAEGAYKLKEEGSFEKAADSLKSAFAVEDKAKAVEVDKSKVGDEFAKGFDIDEILKEDGYYITGGSHAYETARDQAHIDAEVPPVVDGEKKKIWSAEEDIKKGTAYATGEEHLLKEAVYGKDKAFAKGEDALKISKDHAIASEIAAEEKKLIDAKFHSDEILKKEIVHGVELGMGEDHLFKTEEGHLLHDKDLAHEVGVKKIDEAVGKENHHHKLHNLKDKFLSFLGRVLHMKKCHLVTMRPGELLSIVDCISRSKDPLLCEKFAMCEKKMPLQVILALEKCQKETIPGEVKRCTTLEPLYPSRDIPVKIFKCIVKNTVELVPAEKKQMIEFEECARQVKVESCGRFPWG